MRGSVLLGEHGAMTPGLLISQIHPDVGSDIRIDELDFGECVAGILSRR